MWLFSASKAFCCCSCHAHTASLCVSCRSGADSSLKFGMNFPRQLTIPRNLCRAGTSAGTVISLIAFVLDGSALRPSFVNTWPTQPTSFSRNLHLRRFSLRLTSLAQLSTFLKLASCSPAVLPPIIMSSTMIAQGYPAKICSIERWNTSLASLSSE